MGRLESSKSPGSNRLQGRVFKGQPKPMSLAMKRSVKKRLAEGKKKKKEWMHVKTRSKVDRTAVDIHWCTVANW